LRETCRAVRVQDVVFGRLRVCIRVSVCHAHVLQGFGFG
jgi:hypothetical protein